MAVHIPLHTIPYNFEIFICETEMLKKGFTEEAEYISHSDLNCAPQVRFSFKIETFGL